MPEGVFQIQAEILPEVNERALRTAITELQRRASAQLRPIEVRVTAQQSANVNRSLDALNRNVARLQTQIQSASREMTAFGQASQRAFAAASRSKDAFRANLSKLNADLRATATQARTTGTALQAAFSGARASGAAASSAASSAGLTRTLREQIATAVDLVENGFGRVGAAAGAAFLSSLSSSLTKLSAVIARSNAGLIQSLENLRQGLDRAFSGSDQAAQKATESFSRLEEQIIRTFGSAGEAKTESFARTVLEGSEALRQASQRLKDLGGPGAASLRAEFGSLAQRMASVGAAGRALISTFNSLQGAARGIAAAFAPVVRDANSLRQAFPALANSVNLLGQQFQFLATSAAGYLSVATLIKGINLAADLEVQRVALENLTGSQEKANQVIDEARRISEQSGLGIGEVVKAIQRFIAQGFSVEEAVAQVELLGRAAVAAGGSTEKFGLAAQALSQIISKGVLSQEELRQQLAEQLNLPIDKFYDNLAEALERYGIATNATRQEVISFIQTGQVPAAVAQEALNETLSEAPGVLSAFETRAGTLRGALDRLRTQGLVALEEASADFVTGFTAALRQAGINADGLAAILKPVFDGLLPIFEALVQSVARAQPLLVQLAQLFQSLAPAVASVGSVLSSIIVPALTAVAQVLNAVAPLLNVLLIRFLALRAVGAILTTINVLLAQTSTQLAATAANSILLSRSLGAVSTSLTAVRVGVGALAGPIGLAVTAMALLGNETRDTTKAITDLTGAANDAIVSDFFAEVFERDKTGFGDTVGDVVVTIFRGADAAVKRQAGRTAKIFNDTFREVFEQSPGAAQRIVEQAEAQGLAEAPALRKLFDDLSRAQKQRADDLAATANIGQTAAQVERDYFKILTDGLAALDRISASEDRVTSAIQSRNQAIRRQEEIEGRIAELTAERAALQQNIVAQANEEADALERVRDLDDQIRDLRQEREQLLHDEQRRIEDYIPTLEAFSRNEELAQIAARAATRDRIRAEQDLERLLRNREDSDAARVSVVGKSLEETRAILAITRANLQAQRAANQISEEDLSREEQILEAKDRVREAEIREEETQLRISQILREREDFYRDQEIAVREFNEALQGLSRDEAQLNRDRTAAETAYQQILRGEAGIKSEIRGLTEQLRDLEGQRRDAANAVRDAELAIKKAKEEQRKELAELTKDERELNKIYLERLQTINQFGPAAQQAARQALADSLPALLRGASLIDPATGRSIAGPALINDALIRRISDELLRRPGSDLRAILRQILREVGLQIPGLKSGGVVKGVPGAYGKLIRVGEYGKSEAILPLANQARMAAIIRQPQVLSPILNALPRISLPGGQRLPNLSEKPSSQSSFVTRQEEKRQNQRLTEAVKAGVAAALAEADLGAVNVTNTFASSGDPLTDLRRRQLAREVESSVRQARRGRKY